MKWRCSWEMKNERWWVTWNHAGICSNEDRVVGGHGSIVTNDFNVKTSSSFERSNSCWVVSVEQSGNRENSHRVHIGANLNWRDCERGKKEEKNEEKNGSGLKVSRDNKGKERGFQLNLISHFLPEAQRRSAMSERAIRFLITNAQVIDNRRRKKYRERVYKVYFCFFSSFFLLDLQFNCFYLLLCFLRGHPWGFNL